MVLWKTALSDSDNNEKDISYFGKNLEEMSRHISLSSSNPQINDSDDTLHLRLSDLFQSLLWHNQV